MNAVTLQVGAWGLQLLISLPVQEKPKIQWHLNQHPMTFCEGCLRMNRGQRWWNLMVQPSFASAIVTEQLQEAADCQKWLDGRVAAAHQRPAVFD
mmetsp:Transcript_61003/g.108450  ORF Transcript_61003/g.108450 Transcript_61003/m.108450 type:complete len:95 (-) Transcript_61003:252-536(-)